MSFIVYICIIVTPTFMPAECKYDLSGLSYSLLVILLVGIDGIWASMTISKWILYMNTFRMGPLESSITS